MQLQNKPTPSPASPARPRRPTGAARLSVCGVVLSLVAAASAQVGDAARQLQSPISGLLVLPVESSAQFGGAPSNANRYGFSFEPVIPLPIGDDWQLVSLTVVPFEVRPGTGEAERTGLGDIEQTLLLGPQSSGSVGWGLGVAGIFPSATSDELGAGAWGVGPAALAVLEIGPLTLGTFARHHWDIDEADRDNGRSTRLQPFAALTLLESISVGTEVRADRDWQRETWSARAEVGLSHTVPVAEHGVTYGVSGQRWLERAADDPTWALVLRIGLLHLDDDDQQDDL